MRVVHTVSAKRAWRKPLEHVPFVRVENIWEQRFGVQVRDLRRARGWTQDDLAERLTAAGFPIHQTTVAKMEGGTRPTNVGEIAALAELFDVPIGTLFDRTPDMEHELRLMAAQRAIEAMNLEKAQLQQRLKELEKERVTAIKNFRDYQAFTRRLMEGGAASGEHPEAP
jgi:transcriptional regulator with XRE-family HTH domain